LTVAAEIIPSSEEFFFAASRTLGGHAVPESCFGEAVQQRFYQRLTEIAAAGLAAFHALECRAARSLSFWFLLSRHFLWYKAEFCR